MSEKTYKVWIEVEEKDEENDEYTTIEQLGVHEFNDPEEAIEFAESLHSQAVLNLQ